MTVNVSYPGVYIQEIPSGVRTITGVSTSVGAFLGLAPQGPTDKARLVTSWTEYTSYFGGLVAGQPLGYAVKSFFDNGGSQTYVVRLSGGGAKVASVAIDGLTINAASAGAWANSYKVKITTGTDRFTLEVQRVSGTDTQTVERFDGLSIKKGAPPPNLWVRNGEGFSRRSACHGSRSVRSSGRLPARAAPG